MIAYILTGISALGGLASCGLGLVLSWTLIQSGRSGLLESGVGLFIAVMSLLYAAHPLYALSLIKADKLVWCSIYDIVLIVISLILCYGLGTAVAAAAQP